MLTAVTGINWGDEGKGRVIDLLAEHADIVARYQGGNNAGHTVVTEQGKFILNLLPSGILHPDVTCVLGWSSTWTIWPGRWTPSRRAASPSARRT